MAVLTKITQRSLADNAVSSAKIQADALGATDLAPNSVGASELADDAVDAAAIADGAVTDAKLSAGTAEGDSFSLPGQHVKIPAVTTTQRNALTAAVGMLIYNSTLGMLQQYNATGWQSITSPPTVTSINPTTADETNDSIVITGSNFETGVTVKIIGNNGTEYNPASTTRNSTTQITITRGSDITVSNEPYDIKVSNPSGLTATLENALDAGGSPSWTSFLNGLTGAGQATSGRIATITDLATGTHDTLAATDPDGNTITYSVIGTDTWAAQNIALNASTGVVSGDPTNQTSDTTYTNTIRATDTGGNYTDQSLNIIVQKGLDGSTSSRAAKSCQKIMNLTSTTTSGTYWIYADTSVAAAQHYCDMSTHSGIGWTLVATRATNTAMSGNSTGDWRGSYGTTLTTMGQSIGGNGADNLYKGDWQHFGAWIYARQEIGPAIGGRPGTNIYWKTLSTNAHRTFFGLDLVYMQSYTTSSDNYLDCYTNFKAVGTPVSGGSLVNDCGAHGYHGWSNDPGLSWCWWHHPSNHPGTGSCGAPGTSDYSHGHFGNAWIGGGT